MNARSLAYQDQLALTGDKSYSQPEWRPVFRKGLVLVHDRTSSGGERVRVFTFREMQTLVASRNITETVDA
jgi:hypothetical protein